MLHGLLSRRLRRGRQTASVPLPAAWYEVAYANPGRRDGPVTVPDEASALGAARSMSAGGDLVDVFLVLDGGPRRPVASFSHGLPVLGAAARVPAAADAAQAPVFRLRGTGDARAAAVRFPDGISPLPVAAMSGGPLRPRRLLYPDGTSLTYRPDGRGGGRAGTADGIVPADGPDAGWLQVIRYPGAGSFAAPAAVHPALLCPAGADPYGCMTRRQRRRFSLFDLAEAAGQDAAGMPASLVDIGDFLTADDPREILQVSDAALSCGSRGVSVRLIGDYLGGAGTDMLELRDTDLVRVMLPAFHPAEVGPHARQLFAPDPGRPRRVIPGPRAELLRDGGW